MAWDHTENRELFLVWVEGSDGNWYTMLVINLPPEPSGELADGRKWRRFTREEGP